MVKKPPKKTIWVDLGNCRYIFIKFNVRDYQFWLPPPVVKCRYPLSKAKDKMITARIITIPEFKIYEDYLKIYMCRHDGCRTNLSKIFVNKELIVGYIA